LELGRVQLSQKVFVSSRPEFVLILLIISKTLDTANINVGRTATTCTGANEVADCNNACQDEKVLGDGTCDGKNCNDALIATGKSRTGATPDAGCQAVFNCVDFITTGWIASSSSRATRAASRSRIFSRTVMAQAKARMCDFNGLGGVPTRQRSWREARQILALPNSRCIFLSAALLRRGYDSWTV
jgi:hypothetical protein